MSVIIPGATYFRVHAIPMGESKVCELHINGSYTICAAPEFELKHHPVCNHGPELLPAFAEAKRKHLVEVDELRKTNESKYGRDPRDEWKYEQPARVVTVHGRDDAILETICFGADGPSRIYELVSARMDPASRPLVTEAMVYHCIKRGRVCSLKGYLAGQMRVIYTGKYDGPTGVPLSDEFRKTASFRVDLSNMPVDYIIPQPIVANNLGCVIL